MNMTKHSSTSRGKYRETYYLSIHTDLFLKLNTFGLQSFSLICVIFQSSMCIMQLTRLQILVPKL